MILLLLPTCTGMEVINSSTIIRIEAISNYSKLFFSNGKTLVIAKVLAWFENKLPRGSFIRVHRSHIISLQHVRTWCNGRNNKIILCDDTPVDVSRRKKRMVMEAFRNHYAA
jgi:two-component system, LytTR family, response regulator